MLSSRFIPAETVVKILLRSWERRYSNVLLSKYLFFKHFQRLAFAQNPAVRPSRICSTRNIS